uniref:Uncharacterized protein AlNc14C209G8881 n=1 Tax=Albugo laibachii Nc14 TaxID=890382 RepID=F0WR74_9STRA|nr:conserved hypothetical protein [Albugo laibachii Nc14]|eukprot:CCA23835.1 conserved hypothetical protein [Albugo laibachii Nc14]
MSVVKVTVDLGSNLDGSLFVRCFRVNNNTALQIDLIDGTLVWCITVDESHKPPALDISGMRYLHILESIFTVSSSISNDPKTNSGYLLHWNRSNSVLTLSQEVDYYDRKKLITTKFTALHLTPVSAKELNSYWNILLKEIVSHQLESKREREELEHVAEERKRVMLAKDETVKAALDAKAKLENHVFNAFINLLNAKKERIAQLESDSYKVRSKSS